MRRMMDTPERIAVIRALPGVGDLLCGVPALRALRQEYPQACITYVGLPGRAWLAERFPELVDRWIDLAWWPSIPEARGDPADTLRWLAGSDAAFDVAVQLQGSGGPINRLARVLAPAGTAVVHVQPGETLDPGGGWITRPWPETGHEIERCLALTSALGARRVPAQLEFALRTADLAEADERWPRRGPLAVVHPGASRADRRWSVEGFAAVAAALDRAGFDVAVAGTTAERPVTRSVTSGSGRPLPVVDGLSLGGYAALLSRAALLVVNDTGVAHLGVAVGVPTVVVGTTSDLDRWGPLDRDRHRVVPTCGDRDRDVDAVLGALSSIRPRLPGADRASR